MALSDTSIKRFDSYTWQARFLPALIVILPLNISSGLWITQKFSLFERLASTSLASLVVAYLLAQIGRDLGYRKQPKLWEKWGGAPTTQLLRHRTATTNAVLRERYHRQLKALQPDLYIPTAEEEEIDPCKADEVYGACVRFLIAHSRDQKQFPLVFKENVNYGFRRNLWGMKMFGIVLAGVGLATCLARLWIDWKRLNHLTVEPSVIGLCDLTLLTFWLSWVRPNWVRIAADAYADRLIETCEHLKPPVVEEKKVIWPPSTS